MDWVAIITRYYNAGYYTADQVKIFVEKLKITADDYKTITGDTYTTTTVS